MRIKLFEDVGGLTLCVRGVHSCQSKRLHERGWHDSKGARQVRLCPGKLSSASACTVSGSNIASDVSYAQVTILMASTFLFQVFLLSFFLGIEEHQRLSCTFRFGFCTICGLNAVKPNEGSFNGVVAHMMLGVRNCPHSVRCKTKHHLCGCKNVDIAFLTLHSP